jgi:hypothetical protein
MSGHDCGDLLPYFYNLQIGPRSLPTSHAILGHDCCWLAPFFVIDTGSRCLPEFRAIAIGGHDRRWLASLLRSLARRLVPCWPGPQVADIGHYIW